MQQSKFIKLNVGGKYFQTTSETLSRFGENFLTQLVSGKIPSTMENDCYVIDRSGQIFGKILDYLRSGVMILERDYPIESIVLEASFYSIDLSPVFLGGVENGCYKSAILDHQGLFNILYIERDKEQPWFVGITGVIKEEKNRREVWTEFWRKRCIIRNGMIECDNFQIYQVAEETIAVKQSDLMLEVRNLTLVSKAGTDKEYNSKCKPQDYPKLTGQWLGDRFMTNKQYLSMSIFQIPTQDDPDQNPPSTPTSASNVEQFQTPKASIVCHMMCGNENVGPLPVHILCSHFFLIGSFWVFVNGSRLLSYRPICSETDSGVVQKFSGWVRFRR